MAGSLAGVIEHTFMFPVDTLKTHVQCDRCGKFARPGFSFVGYGADGCVHALKTLVKAEGVARLWRGVSTMFIGCVPAHAAYFSIYELVKERTGANGAGHHPMGAAVSGMLATFAHDSIMTPMDTVKQRLQLGYYRDIPHGIRHMARAEGIGSFFVSLPTTLTMNLPFGAVMVTSNESLKVLLAGPNGEQSVGTYLVAGSGAGAIAAIATTPLDMIKTRLQTQQLVSVTAGGGNVPHMTKASTPAGGAGVAAGAGASTTSMQHGFLGQQTRRVMTASASAAPSVAAAAAELTPARLTGAIDAARHIYREAGLFGFMRGTVPRLLVSMPSVAISWTTYEIAKGYLRDRV